MAFHQISPRLHLSSTLSGKFSNTLFVSIHLEFGSYSDELNTLGQVFRYSDVALEATYVRNAFDTDICPS